MARLFRRSKAPARAENIDELSRLNRGFGSFMAEDTGSQPGYILPFGKTQKSELAYRRGYSPSRVIEPNQYIEEPSDLEMPQYAPEFEHYYQQLPQDGISSFLNSYNESVMPIATSEDGGVVLSDGMTIYQDGSLKNQSGQIVNGVASLPGGYTLYSDGSVRRSGLENLIQGVFGQNQAITQEYGNYNPELEPGSGYNLGTDIRTRDLETRGQFLPDDVRVVQVLQDDGTRWGDQSGHQGYGNSVLVQLPSGEMLRFSHLAQLPNVQPGQMIPAGTSFIYPGATGNVSGEHLDLEYYNVDGQLSDPSTFQGFQNARTGTGQLMSLANLSPEIQQASREVVQQQQQFMPASMETGQAQPTMSASMADPSVSLNINQQAPRPELGTSVNKLGDKIGLNPQGTLGIGELVAGDREAAGQELARTGKRMNLPEMNISEVVSGTASPQQALSRNIERVQPTGNRIDLGISEVLRGDKAGAGRVFNDTKSRVMAKIEAGLDAITPDAFAAENTQQTPEPIINQSGESILQKAGAGIDRLKSAFQGFSNQSRPNMSDLGGNKEVGDSPANALASFAPETTNQATPDRRDPFFKGEGASRYASFINPTGSDNRTLTTETFSPNFFSDGGRVADVFRGSANAPKAQGLYIDNVKQQYLQRYGDAGKYDQGDVQRILGSIGNTELGYTPNLPAPKQTYQPTLDDYLRMGKSVDQWYAETGRQGELDYMRANGIDPSSRGQSAPTPQQVNQMGTTGDRGSSTVQYPSGRTVTAAPGTTLRADSSGNVQQTRQGDSPVKSSSAQLAYRPSNEQGLFNRAYNAITKLFRR